MFIISAAGNTQSIKDVDKLPENNNDENDTLMIYLGVSAIERTPVDAKMAFFSLDLDMLVLLIANFDHLPRKTLTSLFPCTANRSIWKDLCEKKQKFCQDCMLSWAQTSQGRVYGTRKKTCLKLFLEADTEERSARKMT